MRNFRSSGSEEHEIETATRDVAAPASPAECSATTTVIRELEKIAADLVSGHPSMARNEAASIRLRKAAQAMKDAIG